MVGLQSKRQKARTPHCRWPCSDGKGVTAGGKPKASKLNSGHFWGNSEREKTREKLDGSAAAAVERQDDGQKISQHLLQRFG
ncbi:hypothetical protein MUK42_36371 [Musa troglodytarum]|uniref:Uncharacterized protein n=1 Tax=Musa troglodytarum TaxID=320322 RepID=A0A9E7GI33_9LILI|nr:hypothetical protein MUK42_36371 [Musa troglodytarum]